MEALNECTGEVAIPCDFDQIAGSGVPLYGPISIELVFYRHAALSASLVRASV